MFTLQPHQRVSRRSQSLSPRRSFPLVITPRRNRSLWRKPALVGTKRTFDEAFLDDDDDDCILYPALDLYMETSKSPSTGASSDGPSSPPGGIMVGGALPRPQPLLDFEMHPVGPRRKWRDVLHKQRYQARVQQHREANPTDDLGSVTTNHPPSDRSRQHPQTSSHVAFHYAIRCIHPCVSINDVYRE